MCLAKKLALALGKISEMAALYHDDIVWTMSESLVSLGGTPTGKDAVVEYNKFVDTTHDSATAKVQILDALEQGDLSAARFIYRSRMLPSHEPFEGEYVLFVKERDGKIIEVNERVDSLKIALSRGLAESTGKSL